MNFRKFSKRFLLYRIKRGDFRAISVPVYWDRFCAVVEQAIKVSEGETNLDGLKRALRELHLIDSEYAKFDDEGD